MDKLLERSPGEYFRVEEGTEELVLTSVWKSLLSAGLVDSHHEAILLDQIFDLFDVSVLHGIQSLVVDVFQEIQSEDILRYCGVTTTECLLQWIERCIVYCENECSRIGEVDLGTVERQESLKRALYFADAAHEVSIYILSWKHIEKSIHYKQSDSLGPLSQSTIKSFEEVQSVAALLSFISKCMLIALDAGGNKLFDRVHRQDSILEQMQKSEDTLLCSILQKSLHEESFEGKTTLTVLADILLHYRNDTKGEWNKESVLSLLSYCLLCEDIATIQSLEQAMHMYLTVPREDVLIWSLAVYLDRASNDPMYLEKAKLLSQEDAICGKIPIEYLQKFMELGESPTALSLLYQKWIDPNVTSDVIGCIQILLHEGLVLECYVQLKQYLRHIPKASHHEKAKLYWHEMFASGSKSGLLFQLIRLPISVNKEEECVVEWLMTAYEQHQDSIYIKALCLYFIIRGRTEEASEHFEKLNLNPDIEWDIYLIQLIELATRYTIIQDCGSHKFMLQADSNRLAQQTSTDIAQAAPQMTAHPGLLFSKGPMDIDKSSAGVVFNSNPSRASLHGMRKNTNRRTKEPHAFDKVLGLA